MKAIILPIDTEIYQGTKEDPNTNIVKNVLEESGFSIEMEKVIPRDFEVTKAIFSRIIDDQIGDLIITIGGIGCAASDCVPEASKELFDREVPGLAEGMRSYMIQKDRKAMLLRGCVGIKNHCVILNLPDTTNIIKEVLEYILPEIVCLIEEL